MAGDGVTHDGTDIDLGGQRDNRGITISLIPGNWLVMYDNTNNKTPCSPTTDTPIDYPQRQHLDIVTLVLLPSAEEAIDV